MIISSIDIGSNTVLMLIANVSLSDKKVDTIKNFYRVPRISKGLVKGQNISEGKINELINILKEYETIIKSYKCNDVIVVGTNALRIASNSAYIKNKIKEMFNWNLKIISGDEEARLSFLGAIYSYNHINENKVVIDIGGGSTEIVYGNLREIIFKKSYNFGVVSLTEKYIKSSVPTKEELALMQKELDFVFSELPQYIPINIFPIAVAGTPTTLSCIKQNIKLYDEKIVENSSLSIKDINSIIKNLEKMTSSDIKDKYGQVVDGREDVLLSGTLILKSFMESLKLNKITVSNKGLRYGVLIDYINKLI